MNINDLPIEILPIIFKNLTGPDVLTCHRVCQKWRLVVDGVSDDFWRQICRKGLNYLREYDEIYEEAYRRATLSWRELYITLSRWPKVHTADIQVFRLPDNVIHFQLLGDGIISYPCNNNNYDTTVNQIFYCNTIVYYDLKIMQEQHRTHFDFFFTNYAENDKLLIVRNHTEGLDVIIKSSKGHYAFGGNEYLFFLELLGDKFYFQSFDKMYCCKLVEQNGGAHLDTREITSDSVYTDWKYVEGITSVGSEVYIRTSSHNIYSVIDNKTEPLVSFYNCENSLEVIKYYGFKWTARDISYHLRMNLGQYYAEQHVPRSLFTTDINAAWAFDKVIIIATPAPNRKLLIYYDPYDSNNKLTLFNSVPDVSIDLDAYEIGDSRRNPRVRKIDVVEAINGHILVVSCDLALYIIDVNHDGRQTEPCYGK